MVDWKQRLIHKIKATHKKFVLVRDEDFLLEYPTVKPMLEPDFIIERCSTPLQVRIRLELHRDDSIKRLLLIVPNDYVLIPDLERRASFLQINLQDMFPMFHRASLLGQDDGVLSALSALKVYEKQNQSQTMHLIEEIVRHTISERDRISIEQVEASLDKMEVINAEEDRPEYWFETVQSLGTIRRILFEYPFTQTEARFETLVKRLNTSFQIFLAYKYNGLFTRSGLQKPYTVSRVLDHLNGSSAAKKALIVLDGINFWQWDVIATMLRELKIQVETGATFAFIPSITAFSRQSLFRGGNPDLTQDNSKENALFKEYWLRQGKQAHQIHYAKFGVHQSLDVDNFSRSFDILGLVCNDLDDIMHGTIMGNRQLFNSTRQWLFESKFAEMVKKLLANGYTCFITTDHGNVEAHGNGMLGVHEKAGVHSRGKRHLNFANSILLERYKSQQDMSRFGESGLSLYSTDTSAFAPNNTTLVTHGGSHFWEVLIPFIKIKNEQA